MTMVLKAGEARAEGKAEDNGEYDDLGSSRRYIESCKEIRLIPILEIVCRSDFTNNNGLSYIWPSVFRFFDLRASPSFSK